MSIDILLDSNGDETIADEKSSLFITCTFKDEDEDLVIPDSIKWSLTDRYGNYIHDRNQVVVTQPALSITVILSNLDLAMQTSEIRMLKVKRLFTIEAIYDSSLQDNLPLNKSVVFFIQNLRKIT